MRQPLSLGLLQSFGNDIAGAVTDYTNKRDISNALSQAKSPDGTVDYNKLVQNLLGSGHTKEALTAAALAKSINPTPSFGVNPVTGEYYNRANPTQSFAPSGGGGKPLAIAETDKLAEQGQTYNQLNDLASTFQPDYAGYTVPQKLELAKQGGVAGQAARASGLITDKDVAASQWWDNYGTWAEGIRNKLYGSVLTQSDIGQFEKYRITPSTDPARVPEFLTYQRDIVGRAIERKSASLKASHYNPQAIDEAYGLQNGQLPGQNMNVGREVPDEYKNTPAIPGASQITTNPNGAYFPSQQQLIQHAQEAIKAGADPQAVQSRLQQMLNGQ